MPEQSNFLMAWESSRRGDEPGQILTCRENSTCRRRQAWNEGSELHPG